MLPNTQIKVLNELSSDGKKIHRENTIYEYSR